MTIVSSVPPVIPTPIFVWLKTVSVACTRYPRCCPPHSSVSAWLSRLPFLSFSLSLFACPYLFWHFVQLLQPLPSLDVYAVVCRGCRSQGPLCWEPSATEDAFFKSDSATMEVDMLRLMPRVLPSYSFIAVFSIYLATLSNSHSQLNVKWHASKGMLRTQKLKSPLLRIQSWRMSSH